MLTLNEMSEGIFVTIMVLTLEMKLHFFSVDPLWKKTQNYLTGKIVFSLRFPLSGKIRFTNEYFFPYISTKCNYINLSFKTCQY